MRDLTAAQAAEIAKYQKVYAALPGYAMGEARQIAARRALGERVDLFHLPILDVGCGRGEALRIAREVGYRGGICGLDPVNANRAAKPWPVVKGVAWDLPFDAAEFGTVTCWDVLEHLLPDDQGLALAEIGRVASRRILVSIGMHSSAGWGDVGELHVGLRSEEEWAEMLDVAWIDWSIRRRPDLDAEKINTCWEAVR